MFETAELNRKTSKEEFDAAEPEVRTALLAAQEKLKAADFSVILVIGGVDGAGKGETVNLLHEWMDARHLDTHAFGTPSDEERERPPFWRFWRVLPARGRIGIFFGSWYTDPIVRRVYRESKKAELEPALQRIAAFEKMLADDGTVIIKWWFHLSKAAQQRRLKALERDPETRWRVTRQDWKNFKLYDRFRKVSEQALRATSTGEAPWLVIEGVDHRYRSLTAARDLLERLTRRLGARPAGAPPKPAQVGQNPYTILDTLDLSRKLAEKKYQTELERRQGALNRLWRKARAKGMSAVLVFEGWDAAGKGGAIRRITPALDARDYHVISVAAPTDEEKARHYLWRFWRHIARAGRVTIFDRSWYGRVLVERVEGFAREEEWRRAYAEINQFEEQLTEHGVVLIKYWLHIDAPEQLRRFTEREKVAFKKYKITGEDYRNREKMHDYELAANEMIERTNTREAPWVLVESNDKRYARIKILKALCDRLDLS
ncbi:MAG TPA: polyphosphate:AMP phosphotransferase [Gemmatimonadales bacterium]|nr:polyphosphate:AMP phosphotransferase [Gemmatimonadales bacterium]